MNAGVVVNEDALGGEAHRVLTTSLENLESIPDPKENLPAPGPGSCHRGTIDRNKFSVK